MGLGHNELKIEVAMPSKINSWFEQCAKSVTNIVALGNQSAIEVDYIDYYICGSNQVFQYSALFPASVCMFSKPRIAHGQIMEMWLGNNCSFVKVFLDEWMYSMLQMFKRAKQAVYTNVTVITSNKKKLQKA